MSKLPVETRPIRIAPALAVVLEDLLRPHTGKKLEAAQRAVLRVYQSGAQMDHGGWVAAYTRAITEAVQEKAVPVAT